MDLKYLQVTKENAVATVKINRPEALNALNTDILKEIKTCFEELEKDSSLRIVFVTGEGKAFVAGADIAAMKEYDSKKAEEFSKLGQSAFDTIDSSRLVSIALINGFALGGGMELALSCDMRIASESAKMGLPEVSLGLIPGFGGTQRLSRLIGVGRALEIILSGDMITAEDAYRIGIVNKISPPENLLETGEKLAKSILSRGPEAVSKAKEVVKKGVNLSLDNGQKLEKKEFSLLFDGAQSKEGLGAFLEKRKPNF
ncbi:MAG: enoyl-CoA hydratase/isomerase family protein [Leptospiraceae bacterium]|nr:enoyl-CoA hydratase/isomerase family protein [Leptospiraceae bacterium]